MSVAADAPAGSPAGPRGAGGAGGDPFLPAPRAPVMRESRVARALGLVAIAAVLVLVLLLSIGVGAKAIPIDRAFDLLIHPDASYDSDVIRDLRIPRTVVGLLVGAALGVSGALMQAVTRNPLADPGILGVTAGASTAIVVAISLLGPLDPGVAVWFALLGAAVASVVVYGLGARGRSGASPVRLALAGTAVTAALLAFVQGLTLLQPRVFDEYRFWVVGSLSGRQLSVVEQVGPLIVVGLVVALLLARPLNAMALGDDAGRALGVRLGATRAWSALGVTLLAGAATAAAGPIAFVGLTIPHIARAIVGPDQRWIIPYSMLLGPILLLGADVFGRVIERPGEVQVAVVTAVVGAPVFIAFVRRRRIAQL